MPAEQGISTVGLRPASTLIGISLYQMEQAGLFPTDNTSLSRSTTSVGLGLVSSRWRPVAYYNPLITIEK
jgi:hypothetical protein